MNISARRVIRQTGDEDRYEGEITIANAEFNFELILGVEVPTFDSDYFDVRVKIPDDPHELREKFEIVVKKGQEPIELTDEEYILFAHLLVQFAVSLHSHSYAGAARELGQLHLLMPGAQADPRSSEPCAVLASEADDELEFSPKAIEILRATKFGCEFAG